MFFIKTEERVVTRKELLSKGLCHFHNEYLTSVVYDDENGEEREFVSGVSTIQKKWDPVELCIDLEAADVAGSIMTKVNTLVDDPNDLAVIHKIIEKAITHCETEPREAEEGLFSKQRMVDQVRERLMKLYRQEYCRLIWNGSICSEVTVWPNLELMITPSSELKKSAEKDFFKGYKTLSWNGVNAVFWLKMLSSPETVAIVKLREYFGAMGGLLQAKTVFESDMQENPFHVLGERVYYPDKIRARVGTGLVEAVQCFGWPLEKNTCYEALCKFKEVQRLQEEVCKITDPRVKEITIEALRVLNQNLDALKKYFDIWDTYIGNIMCSYQDVDAYIENISSI